MGMCSDSACYLIALFDEQWIIFTRSPLKFLKVGRGYVFRFSWVSSFPNNQYMIHNAIRLVRLHI